MVYLLKMVIFHGYVSHNQMVFCIGSAMQNIQVLGRLANAGCICAGIAGQTNRRERERKPTLRYPLVNSHIAIENGHL